MNSPPEAPQGDWSQWKLTLMSLFTCQGESASETLGERLSDARLSWASLGYTTPLDTSQAFRNVPEKQAVANHFTSIFSLKSILSLRVGAVSLSTPTCLSCSWLMACFWYTEIFRHTVSLKPTALTTAKSGLMAAVHSRSITHMHGYGKTV